LKFSHVYILLAVSVVGTGWLGVKIIDTTFTPSIHPPSVKPLAPIQYKTECQHNADTLDLLREHQGCENDTRRCDCLETVEEMCQLIGEVYRWK